MSCSLAASRSSAHSAARDAARKAAGAVRVGFTNTTEGPALIRLVRRYEAEHQDSTVTLRQVNHLDPYRELRQGEVDVLVGWLALDEPDLVAGPEIDRQERVLAVSSRHPLAQRQALTAKDLAGLPAGEAPPGTSKATWEAFVPTHTPGGRAIPRAHETQDTAETYSLVARGLIVHPTVASMAGRLFRDDIVLIPQPKTEEALMIESTITREFYEAFQRVEFDR